jgi:hypothetical protein
MEVSALLNGYSFNTNAKLLWGRTIIELIKNDKKRPALLTNVRSY